MKLSLDSGHRRRQARAAQGARANEYLKPRKADLRRMLADAAKNTAEEQERANDQPSLIGERR